MLPRTSLRSRLCFLLPSALMLALAGGCTSTDSQLERLCHAAAACSPGTDADFQNCVGYAEYLTTQAEMAGCGTEYHAFLDCEDAHHAGVDRNLRATSECDTQDAAFNACANSPP